MGLGQYTDHYMGHYMGMVFKLVLIKTSDELVRVQRAFMQREDGWTPWASWVLDWEAASYRIGKAL